jgi:hypothetical protein
VAHLKQLKKHTQQKIWLGRNLQVACHPHDQTFFACLLETLQRLKKHNNREAAPTSFELIDDGAMEEHQNTAVYNSCMKR